ncbi:hypothetical protein CAPTEDRAFT_212777 [Capitella teleta]|uniref:Uncharacterized protein n=1 Tax=Capitella teleta TaxID=283909 RepID=R7U902_CAPTE|nr:hypothetical protein CAPTEDRAFT_212777 [Capitella teleta]|eukprot:ELU02419.1 hypothetical protein CAPTEDRAFT_212777 [Capitella teleta]
MDALIEKFAEIDKTWRTSALELAWLQHFSKTWTSLPEWNFKCPSIIPDNMDVSLLVSSERGPCPLCSQAFVAENTPYGIKKHMKFHTKHSISHDGRMHLICRLPCKPRGHYHCLCGMAIIAKERAQHHIRTCLKAVSVITGNDGVHSRSHETFGSSPFERAICSGSTHSPHIGSSSGSLSDSGSDNGSCNSHHSTYSISIGSHRGSPYTSALAHEYTDGHDCHQVSWSAREEKMFLRMQELESKHLIRLKHLRGKEISKCRNKYRVCESYGKKSLHYCFRKKRLSGLYDQDLMESIIRLMEKKMRKM